MTTDKLTLDAPESCGLWCDLCKQHVEDDHSDHAPDCLISLLQDEASVESGREEPLKAGQCPFCDFGSGTRGMDRCGKCGGTGSVFYVGTKTFPNTKSGYEKALEAQVVSLRSDLSKAEQERDHLDNLLMEIASYANPPASENGVWSGSIVEAVKAQAEAHEETAARLNTYIRLYAETQSKLEASQAQVAELRKALERILQTAPWSDADGHKQCLEEALAALTQQDQGDAR